MNPKIQSWILDIDQSIDEIVEFIDGKKDFFHYQKDLKTKKAVERNLEIIGEAVGRIQKKILPLRLRIPEILLAQETGLSTATTTFQMK
ncbi:MAG: HepT-like ribonuclease domain-containing protein [Bacteroidia bacterium]